MTRFHLEMNKTSKLCINKTISIVNFILLSFLYSNRRIGCKIPGRVTKVSKYIMMVNFKQYTYIRRHQFNFSDYGPADVVFGKMEIKIKL